MNKPAPPPATCDTDPAAISTDHAQQLIQQAVTPITQIETTALRAALRAALTAHPFR